MAPSSSRHTSASVLELVARLGQAVAPDLNQRGRRASTQAAFSLLLGINDHDLQAAESTPMAADRALRNKLLMSEAYFGTCPCGAQQAEELQQLVQVLSELQSHSQPTHSQGSAAVAVTHVRVAAAPLQEHDAVLSLLLALQHSCTRSPMPPTGLPVLGRCQQAHTNATAAAAAAGGAAEQQLNQEPHGTHGMAAAQLGTSNGVPAPEHHTCPTSSNGSSISSMVDGIMPMMQRSGDPAHAWAGPWGVPAQGHQGQQQASGHSGSAGRSICTTSVLPLAPRLLHLWGESPGTASLLDRHDTEASEQQQCTPSEVTWPSRGQPMPHKLPNGTKTELGMQQAVAHAALQVVLPKSMGAQLAKEEMLLTLTCLALQGVYSAIDQIASVVPWHGLARPQAQQQLLARVLVMAEQRLRLEAMLLHATTSSPAECSVRLAKQQQQRDSAEAEPVLQAFLAAVHDILLMQSAAVQQLQHMRLCGDVSRSADSVSSGCHGPPAGLTLLQLSVHMEAMEQQLTQLSELCSCTAVQIDTNTATADPWPGGASIWAQRWGWGPSVWQLQGVLQGCELLDHLHHRLVHADAASVPLTCRLLSAALQPQLHAMCQWLHKPSPTLAAWAAVPGCGPAKAAAWEAASQSAPCMPAFLADLQHPLAVAGQQVQLLQLLGGPAGQLAMSLNSLAQAEAQELAVLFSAGTSCSSAATGGFWPPEGTPPASAVPLVHRPPLHAGPPVQVLPLSMGMAQLCSAVALMQNTGMLAAAEVDYVLAVLRQQQDTAAAITLEAATARGRERLALHEAAAKQRLKAASHMERKRLCVMEEQQALMRANAARRAQVRASNLAEEQGLLLGHAQVEHQEAAAQLAAELSASGLKSQQEQLANVDIAAADNKGGPKAHEAAALDSATSPTAACEVATPPASFDIDSAKALLADAAVLPNPHQCRSGGTTTTTSSSVVQPGLAPSSVEASVAAPGQQPHGVGCSILQAQPTPAAAGPGKSPNIWHLHQRSVQQRQERRRQGWARPSESRHVASATSAQPLGVYGKQQQQHMGSNADASLDTTAAKSEQAPLPSLLSTTPTWPVSHAPAHPPLPPQAPMLAPVQTVLDACLLRPTMRQAELTTRACWQLLLNCYDLLGNCRGLQRHFFQQAGDMAQLLAACVNGYAATGWQLSEPQAQALLEGALTQSSCAGTGAGLTLQVRPGRCVMGEQGNCSQLAQGDALLLHTDAPWPLCLVITPAHIEQYGQVWSVLLRLRRTLLQLQQVWRCLGGCRGRTNTAGMGPEPHTGAASTSRGSPELSRRLQQLRLWNHEACHAVASLLGFMQGQLAGSLTKCFENAVCATPVTVLEMRAAHGALLEAARACCLLPAAGNEALRCRIGASSNGGGADSGGRCSAAAHVLIELCWDWQAGLMGQLRHQEAAAIAVGIEGDLSEQCWVWLLDERAWEGAAVLGQGVEDGMAALRAQLAHASAPGHAFADLLVRLGPAFARC